MHTGRSAYHHLLYLAQSQGFAKKRVEEVLDLVGLNEVARRRTGGFSLGMGQRLGIAVAMLGDPSVLILDEPVNGLDPEGVIWIRNLMKHLASQGRTVFVSSHLMSEMALTAEHLIVIGRGRLVADCSVGEFIERGTGQTVLVRSPDAEALADALIREGGRITRRDGTTFHVANLRAERVGELATAGGFVLHELTPQDGSLEAAFMELTRDSLEYETAVPTTSGDAA